MRNRGFLSLRDKKEYREGLDQNSSSSLEAARKKPPKWKTYIFLHVIFLVYSLAAVCSKMAAYQEFGSLLFFAWYGGVLVLLFVYAIVWQQVLKYLDLTTAYANKGVTLFWGILWGVLLFAEHINIWTIIGVAIVFVGILLVVTADD